MYKEIPIFDSSTHPTIDSDWILPKYPQKADISRLESEMQKSNVIAAFASGLKDIGDYKQSNYTSFITQSNASILPIAFFYLDNNDTEITIRRKIDSIIKDKYVGIKLHARLSNFELDNPLIPIVIDYANENNLIVQFCSYLQSSIQSQLKNNIYYLADILRKISNKSKIMIMHGGTINLLEMMEIVREFPNTLLDLSMTLCKYKESSLDLDIKYLFKNFDQRICIGSDYPEYSPSELRERFLFFSEGISQEKAENIAYKNIITFYKLTNL